MFRIRALARLMVRRYRFLSWLYAMALLKTKHFRVDGNSAPLIVFTMGKTGTRSLYCSLEQAVRDRPLYYLHCISESGAEMANRFSVTPRSPAPVFNYWAASYLRGKFAEMGRSRWDIITSVRDPVAVNLSAFFQTIEHWMPDFMVRQKRQDIGVSELVSLFVEQFPHEYSLSWFDAEVLPFFGIDVYAYPFPKQKGYTVIEAEQASMLVFKLEQLDDCCAEAVNDFLDLDTFRLERHNSTEDKEYADIYRTFVQQIRLPEVYLDSMYSSKLVRHFYSEDEIYRFRQRWKLNREGK